jgi:4-hydroxyphenylpyruvate dioxygenase-like putative hemolysin
VRLDHIAYRTADRKKTAQFFIDFFGYKIQDEFTIKFPDGSTAKCIALEPPEKKESSKWILADPIFEPHVRGDGMVEVDHLSSEIEYHMAPEIFVSDGTPDSVVGKWVANRNGVGGIHHLAYQVDDVRQAMVEMSKTGAEFASEDVLTCPDDELHQIFTKPHPLTGTIYEFIKRGEKGFCKDNVQSLMESTKGLK